MVQVQLLLPFTFGTANFTDDDDALEKNGTTSLWNFKPTRANSAFIPTEKSEYEKKVEMSL